MPLGQDSSFPLGLPNSASFILPSLPGLVSKSLLINNCSEGRRREITVNVPCSGPCWEGGGYFRHNQQPAGSLDEIPPWRAALEEEEVVSEGGGRAVSPSVTWEPQLSPGSPDLTSTGTQEPQLLLGALL